MKLYTLDEGEITITLGEGEYIKYGVYTEWTGKNGCIDSECKSVCDTENEAMTKATILGAEYLRRHDSIDIVVTIEVVDEYDYVVEQHELSRVSL